MFDTSLPARSVLFAAGLSLLFAGSATAITDPTAAPDCLDNDPGAGIFFICFDDLVSLSTTGATAFTHVSINDATIMSEADAAIALGLDTSLFATTADQGILNNLVPVIDFVFDTTITLFRVDVVVLPGPGGDPLPVVVQGFRGGELVSALLTDPANLIPGSPANRLLIKDDLGYDAVRLFSVAAACTGFDCEPDIHPSTYFADSVKFVVPEPGTLALMLVGLTGLAGFGRRAS